MVRRGSVSAGPDDGIDNSSLAFVTGFPGSGTTLIDRFLMGHSQVVTTEEKPFLRRVAAFGVKRWPHLPTGLDRLSRNDRDELWASYHRYLEQFLGTDRPAVVVDRMPLNIILLPLVRVLWPNAPFVDMLRHPMDVCLSCFMRYFTPNSMTVHFATMERTVAPYEAVMLTWLNFRTQQPSGVLEIRYEDLVRDPEAEVRRLIDGLGLLWEPGILDHQHSIRRVRTASKDQVTQPIYTSSIARWERYSELMAPWSDRLLKLASKLGY